MSVKVMYKGNEIINSNADETKTIKTGGKYCEADIIVQNTQDGGAVIEPKDVNFYNPLGTLLYSYTTTEALALEEMPDVPAFEGMATDGWNHTLAEMKRQVQYSGVADIGCQYYWADKTTRLYMNIDNSSYLHPYLSFRLNGTVTIDWGDNSPTETITATQAVTDPPTIKYHQYSGVGKYIIKIHYDTDSTIFGFGEYLGNGNQGIFDGSDGSKRIYANYLYRADMYCPDSRPLIWYDSSFNNFYNLKYLLQRMPCSVSYATALSCYIQSIPASYESYERDIYFPQANYCFALRTVSVASCARNLGTLNLLANDYSLKRIVFPCDLYENVTTPRYYNNTAQSCFTLEEVYLPELMLTVGGGICQSCNNLRKVLIPDVSTISSKVFQNCDCLMTYDFLCCTTVPSLENTNAFSCSTTARTNAYDRRMFVPFRLYSSWITATNWVTYADIIFAAKRFSVGDTLPSDATWYKDEKHTIPVSEITEDGIYFAELNEVEE